jgi:hypothetical protein
VTVGVLPMRCVGGALLTLQIFALDPMEARKFSKIQTISKTVRRRAKGSENSQADLASGCEGRVWFSRRTFRDGWGGTQGFDPRPVNIFGLCSTSLIIEHFIVAVVYNMSDQKLLGDGGLTHKNFRSVARRCSRLTNFGIYTEAGKIAICRCVAPQWHFLTFFASWTHVFATTSLKFS